MPLEDDSDDEWPPPDRLLPAEDRIWRHPSEISALAFGDAPDKRTSDRSRTRRVVMMGALLAGVAATLAVVWAARPIKTPDEATPPAITVASNRTSPTPVAVTNDSGLLTGDLATTFAPSVARVEALHDGTWTTSSALWVDHDGTLVAPAARVTAADALMVVGTDGSRQPATVAGIDDATTLAAIAVEHTAGIPIEATAIRPMSGQRATAIGCGTRSRPDQHDAVTVTSVVVRSTDQRAMVHGTLLHDVIHLDRELPRDVDGGGLVDPSGHLIGLIVGNTDDQPTGTVIPAATAIDTARALRANGHIERSWLGVRAVDIDPARAAMLSITGGARVTEVTPGSPAAAGGVQLDDVLVSVGDQPVADASDLVMALRSHRPGTRTSITVQRGTEHLDLAVTLGG
ncbi:MAG: S1C family serine protease [Aquihabitans sp.]